MVLKPAVVGFATSCLLLAGQPLDQVQVSKTEHFDLPSGGSLRLKNSIGEVTVESWDHAGVEVTTVKRPIREYPPQDRRKAAKNLDRVSVSSHLSGDELVITTDFPKRGFLYLLNVNFFMDYRIKVPANTRLIVDHTSGEVHVENLTSDIQVAVRHGEITLDVPASNRYAIHASSHWGSVVSDLPGTEKRRFWLIGHQAGNAGSQAPHQLNLKVGYGDIIIFKTPIPKLPGPLSLSGKQSGT